MSATQYLFYVYVDNNSEDPSFCIVKESFWNKNKHLDDEELGDLGGLLGERWSEDQEAIYSYYNETLDDIVEDPNEGTKALLLLGLKEIPSSEWPDFENPF